MCFLDNDIDTAESELNSERNLKISSICLVSLKGEVGCRSKTLSTLGMFSKAWITGSIPGYSSEANFFGRRKGTSAEYDLATSAISSSSVDTITLST